jgi:hypothetical protein
MCDDPFGWVEVGAVVGVGVAVGVVVGVGVVEWVFSEECMSISDLIEAHEAIIARLRELDGALVGVATDGKLSLKDVVAHLQGHKEASLSLTIACGEAAKNGVDVDWEIRIGPSWKPHKKGEGRTLADAFNSFKSHGHGVEKVVEELGL